MKTTFLLIFLSLGQILPGQWKSLKGPYGGNVYNYKNEGSSSYACTSNGVYRSDDDGKNWTCLNDNLPEFNYSSAVCVENDEIFLVYNSNITTSKPKLAYSNDRGNHWILRNFPDLDGYVSELVFSNGILLSYTGTQLIESNDKGNTWKLIASDPKINYVHFLRANHSYFFLADNSNKIFRRSVLDTSWQLILNNADEISDIHLTDSLLIITKNNKIGLRSIDNGLNWNNISILGHNGTSKIAEFGDTLYFSRGDQIFKSTDKGFHWNLIQNISPNLGNINDLFRAGNSLLASKWAVGLLRTNNEFHTYEPSSTGIYSTDCERLVATDSFLFVITQNSLERYDLINKKWADKSLLLRKDFTELYYLKGHLFVVSGYTNAIYISNDNGFNFTEVTMPINIFGSSWITNTMVEFQDKIIYKCYDGILVSDDFGLNWTAVNFLSPTGRNLTVYNITKYDNQILLYAYNSKTKISDVYTCYDLSAPSLVYPVNFPPDLSYYHFNQFLVVQNELFFYLNTHKGSGLFKYNPATYDLFECKGLPDFTNYNNNYLRIIKYNNQFLLYTADAYYKSDDAGLSWVQIFDNLNFPFSTYYLTDLESKDDHIYATSFSYGVLETSWDELKLGKVKGLVYYDKNDNDTFDANDETLNNAFIQSKQTYNLLSTVSNGNFTFSYPATFRDTLIPVYFSKHGYFNPIQLPFKSGDTTLEFAFKLPQKIEDVEVQMHPYSRARAGFSYALDLVVKNDGTENCSGQLILDYDGIFDYKSSSISPDQIINNTLIWNIKDLQRFEERKIKLEFFLPGTVKARTNYTHHLSFTNLNITDIDLADNEAIIKDSVRTKNLANEMTVDKSMMSQKQLDNRTILHYDIRFQNTGDTDVEYIKLSVSLGGYDLSSLHIESSSHPYTFENNGTLLVYLDNIHLPDSASNESQSHGYFSFNIIPLQESVIDKKITNRAIIYYDYNQLDWTNDAITKIVDMVDSKNLSYNKSQNVFAVPNPNSGNFELYGRYLDNKKIDAIKIYNLQGQCVYELKDLLHPGYKLNLEDLNPGLYFLKLGNSIMNTCKIIIQK